MSKTIFIAKKLVTTVAACVNICLAILKFCIGYFMSSPLLMADGIHSFTDVLADMTAFLAARFGQKKPDSTFQYGYHRLETLASIFIAIVLILAAYAILYAGVLHPFHAQVSSYKNSIVLITAGVSLLVNLAAYFYMKKINSQYHSDLIKSCAYHQFSDALTTSLVFLSVVLDEFGFLDLTRFVTVVIIFLIVKCSYELLVSGFQEILDKCVSEEKTKAYKEVIEQVEGVLSVHDLRTRTIAGYVILDCHVTVNELTVVSECDFVAHSVEGRLKSTFPEIKDVTIHMDPHCYELDEGHKKWPSREHILKDLSQNIGLTVYDDTVFLTYSDKGVKVHILTNIGYDEDVIIKSQKNLQWVKSIEVYVKS